MTDLVEIFAAQFERLERGWFELLKDLPDDRLFLVFDRAAAADRQMTPASLLIRSAARIEQVFGGLTVRLWDDPFEWTLPESLSTRERVTGYLHEVRDLRLKGLSMFRTDKELFCTVPAPEQLTPVAEVLISALLDAAELYEKALFSIELPEGPQ